MKIPDTKIAVTLYNVREFCKTESEFDRTLDRICDIGYKAVQVSGVSLPADVIRKQLDKHDLFCCAAHEGMAAISGDPAALIEKLQTLGCDFTALGSPNPPYLNSYSMFCELAEMFKKTGAALQEKGLRLGYHNHAHEFKKFPECSKVALERFYELTDVPGTPIVYAELDVHWVTRGGGNPGRWIRNLKGRMPVIHFKDFAFINGEPRFCEIGEGNLDWEDILKACEEIGVRWYSIEQDQEIPNRDIFESIRISYNNLRAMGVR